MKGLRQENGQTLVEFTLTVVICLTLLLFLLDGSRVLWHYITVSHAARAGARYAIVHGANSPAPVGPNNYAALVAHVQHSAVGLKPDTLVVTAHWPTNNRPGSIVTVRVTYRVRPVIGLFWFGRPLTLSASSTMVIQN